MVLLDWGITRINHQLTNQIGHHLFFSCNNLNRRNPHPFVVSVETATAAGGQSGGAVVTGLAAGSADPPGAVLPQVGPDACVPGASHVFGGGPAILAQIEEHVTKDAGHDAGLHAAEFGIEHLARRVALFVAYCCFGTVLDQDEHALPRDDPLASSQV